MKIKYDWPASKKNNAMQWCTENTYEQIHFMDKINSAILLASIIIHAPNLTDKIIWRMEHVKEMWWMESVILILIEMWWIESV